MSISDQPLILNVRGGARVAVPARLDQITPYVLLEQEDWFEDEIRFVRHYLRQGMRALDVGASFGMYAIALAKAVGASGRIWAFEPTPATAEHLQMSLRLNGLGHVELSRVAISNRSGTLPFVSGSHSELNAVGGTASASDTLVEVDATTLDHAAARSAWSGIDFVKLDVEGHELEVVEGAEKFLRAESPLVMLEVRTPAGLDLRALSRLQALGYEAYRLLPGALALLPFDGDPNRVRLNLFACKPDRAQQLADQGMLAPAGASVPRAATDIAAWVGYVHATPYSRELEAHWRAAANRSRRPGRETYLRGLAAFAHAQAPGRPGGEKAACLEHATRCVAEAIHQYDSPWRRLSYARLAWEWGTAARAVAELRYVTGTSPETLDEPFLSPAPRLDQVPSGGDLSAWLRCAVIEQIEKLHALSSFFAPQESLAQIGAIIDLPQRAPEMDRRWQLARLRCGLQDALSATPPLLARTEDNLNPEFWLAASTLRPPAGS